MIALTDRQAQGRYAVIARFERYGPIEYLDADTLGVRCPICRNPLRLHFHEPRVDLTCTDGCAETDVAAARPGAK